jgi:hypothetical protein
VTLRVSRNDDRSANVVEVMANDKPDHPAIRRSVRWRAPTRQSERDVKFDSDKRESKAGISLRHNLTLGNVGVVQR